MSLRAWANLWRGAEPAEEVAIEEGDGEARPRIEDEVRRASSDPDDWVREAMHAVVDIEAAHAMRVNAELDALPTGQRMERSARHREVRALTVGGSELAREVRKLRLVDDDADRMHSARPKTRAECVEGVRPCPWVSCRHHLFLDVHEVTGAIKFNFPEVEPDAIPMTCSLDVADAGEATLEQVGLLMNVTREGLRQLEISAIRKANMRDLEQGRALLDLHGGYGQRPDPVCAASWADDGD